MTPITKQQFREILSRDLGRDARDADVARFCRISQAAVSQWADDQPIPEGRQLKAMLDRPDLFGRLAGEAANDDAAPALGSGSVEGAG